jgi:hypothetical protein
MKHTNKHSATTRRYHSMHMEVTREHKITLQKLTTVTKWKQKQPHKSTAMMIMYGRLLPNPQSHGSHGSCRDSPATTDHHIQCESFCTRRAPGCIVPHFCDKGEPLLYCVNVQDDRCCDVPPPGPHSGYTLDCKEV